MKNKTNEKRILLIGIILVAVFAVWTVLIQTVDVQPIGQNGTEVGFASFNIWFHKLTGVHMAIYVITDWLGLVPVFVCILFGGMGLLQLIKRRSILKVDYDIIALGIYYIIVIFGYIIFEMIPINYRPIHEKLQELRKNKGLTQEELAEILYVSRTAISKWESGRGYPSIDSLKNIANYFSVSIDDLLSGERLISIAEKENESNIRNICELLFGIVDICTFLLVALPLYPNTKDGYVYSVNLLAYEDVSVLNRLVHWSVFLVLIAAGVVKFSLTQLKVEKGQNIITACSLGIGILSVLYLGMAREAYAVTVAFLLLQ